MEKKGSLFLRSDHMEYGRPTLVSNWHEARESEPRDYNIKDFEPNQRDLHRSTYDRIAVVTDGTFPKKSTCHIHLEEVYSKKDFAERVTRQPMIGPSSVKFIMTTRDTGMPTRGHGSILPCHPRDHNRRYLDTTYYTDYRQPYPHQSKYNSEINEDIDHEKFKKTHSQFTDVSDYRRHGRNKWHNETGKYKAINTNQYDLNPNRNQSENVKDSSY